MVPDPLGSKLVIDANIIFAALSRRSFTFDFIRLLSNHGFRLYSPQYVREEIEARMDKLLMFSKLGRDELDFLINLLFRKIEVVNGPEYRAFLPEAEKLMPSHAKDAPYIALAIALGCPLWSNEKRLKNQKRVEVLATHELKLLI